MGTGPRAESGFDLALTEVIEDGEHWFAVEVGTPAGAELLAELPVRPATAEESQEARAAARAGRRRRWAARWRPATCGICCMGNLEHPRWEEVAVPLPVVRELHDGVPDVLLRRGRRHRRRDRRGGRARAALGVLLHRRPRLPERRQRAADDAARATASG